MVAAGRPGPPRCCSPTANEPSFRFLEPSMSTTEIAGERCVSIDTVKTYLAATTRRLRPGSGVEAGDEAP